MLLWSRYAIAYLGYSFGALRSHFPISPNSSISYRFPIPDFLTIPILTQSLIVETTAVDLLPTLSTLTILYSLFPAPCSLLPRNFYFLY
ncbi:hypothetical protein BJP36_37760 [Moorena producens JHB]|uniref:Uncharacterized protein n=1 Tax=Moorena producens (strain JHB) TaxID=1454205 RepID=A0A9Q9SUG7_MOOP1|nr:hypothetical protein [Moorena producens]WAN69842.1 hypothetical protein BJP36_37760 [Moorena producens JHB]